MILRYVSTIIFEKPRRTGTSSLLVTTKRRRIPELSRPSPRKRFKTILISRLLSTLLRVSITVIRFAPVSCLFSYSGFRISSLNYYDKDL